MKKYILGVLQNMGKVWNSWFTQVSAMEIKESHPYQDRPFYILVDIFLTSKALSRLHGVNNAEWHSIILI